MIFRFSPQAKKCPVPIACRRPASVINSDYRIFTKNITMKIISSKKELDLWLEEIPEEKTLGFVPTMGALHEGHLSLFRKAKSECDLVIGSIYVNPTQFNNPEDLNKYPRNTEKDIQLLETADCADALFLPTAEDMYPDGMQSKTYDLDGLDKVMEGSYRQGHFDGVATVVEQFFHLIKPNRAYFGEKDFQQLKIIQKLKEKKGIPVEIIPVEISREENGLARSSRNERLSEPMRKYAAKIYESLRKAKEIFHEKGISEAKNYVTEFYAAEDSLTLEYFTIAEEDTLQETEFAFQDRVYRAFIAVYAEEVRLIDTIRL